MVDVDPTKGETVTLVIDPDMVVNGVKVNADEFQYDRPHYIRIAALGASYSGMPAWDEEVTTQEFDMDSYIADGSPEEWWNYFVEVTKTVHHPAAYTLDGKINGSGAYNYSPVYKLENGSFTEVTDW